MIRYIAVETGFIEEWLIVDTKYPNRGWGREKQPILGAKVVQQGLREDYAKMLVKSLNEEEAARGT